MKYKIKWTDVSQGYHFPCEIPNLTEAQAKVKLEQFEYRFRRYYKGAMEPYCPFRDVKMVPDD